jgi:hypothetical protein
MHYTYLIGWKTLDRWYYGVRHCKTAIPDLWVKYFTSSKHVAEFRKLNGEPDIVEVRKTFDCRKEAIDWEHRVLKKLRVVTNVRWINRSDNKTYSEEAQQLSRTRLFSDERRKAKWLASLTKSRQSESFKQKQRDNATSQFSDPEKRKRHRDACDGHVGKMWAHDPVTLQNKRVTVLPVGLVKGRYISPAVKQKMVASRTLTRSESNGRFLKKGTMNGN